MRSIIKNKMALIPIVFLIAITGCAGMVENMPSPPDMLVKIKLDGPYDKEIPVKFVNQLKGASLMSDWAIPYIFISVGMHFESQGDATRAIHFFDRAITEFQRRNDISGQGTALNRKIFALNEFGKIQEAYDNIKEVEKKWVNAPLKPFVDHNYGHYYLMNGDYNKALQHFRKSLQANEKFHDDFNLLMLRRDTELEYGIAIILADYFPVMSKRFSLLDFDEVFYKAIRKNVDEGISHLRQVLVLNNEIRKTKVGKFTPENIFQVMESNVYNFLGLACGIKGDFPQALKNLETSMQLARKANFRIGEVDNIFFRNQIYLLEKNITEGQKAARELNEIADKYHLPFYRIWAKFILSRYCLGFGDSSGAIGLLKEAINITEKQRSGLVIDTLKETYMFNRQVLYEALIELLAKEGDYRGAFEIAERAKSRVLVDLLAGRDIGKTAAENELIRQNEKYIQEMTEGYRIMISASGGGNSAFESALDKVQSAETGQRNVLIKIQGQNEELYSLVSAEPPDTERLLQLLDGNTNLISYYVADKVLYIWVVNKDRLHLERIKINKEEVIGLVSSFNAAIAARNKKQTAFASEKIYDTLIKPVSPFLKGERIGFIGHGPLYYLPFSAINSKGRYLVEDFSIFSLPCVNIWKFVMKKHSSETLTVLAFGNPDLGSKQFDLPFAEAEVEKIRKTIPQTKVYLRSEATKNKAKEILGDYGIVHFAAHGFYIENAPMKSGLLLAPVMHDDGKLTADEIFKLRFNGRAVVMSACKTALGLSSTGTEIMGLNRAFLYAGSPSVVATLWSIGDASAADLMDAFYQNLNKNDDIANSLRKAQVEMIRRGYEPYDWAAFTLTGKY